MSGQHLVHSQQLGIDLVGVPLADTQAPAGFRQADFHLDTAAQQATCPAGQTSQVWSERRDASGQTLIRFAAHTCQACPFFGQCTRSPQGRSLTLHPYREALEQRRAMAQTEAYREKLHRRAGIEGTISELVRGYRLRFARYRGLAKLRLQAYFTALALNLKRLVRWWTRPKASAAAAASPSS